MAVREMLLVLLSRGPAYGFQLHGGIEARTGRRRRVNVGQTYATLDRLTRAGLVEPAGTTDDGLPLHRRTEAGAVAARAWLDGADAASADPWDETVDRVLLVASLGGDAGGGDGIRPDRAGRSPAADRGVGGDGDDVDGVDVTLDTVLDGERTRWRVRAEAASARLDAPADDGAAVLAHLAARAELARADAALAWLEQVVALPAGAAMVATDAVRPRRGRRPAGQSTSA